MNQLQKNKQKPIMLSYMDRTYKQTVLFLNNV